MGVGARTLGGEVEGEPSGRGKEVGKGLEISKGWRRASDYGYRGNLMVEWKSGIDPDYVANVVRFLS